ncbi:MAG: HlyD family efflux transporter periplasmic adaptor subunit [bacterium]|nr:HlyD family efflux transporter periplasmic adaptor subunit [bacterium]
MKWMFLALLGAGVVGAGWKFADPRAAQAAEVPESALHSVRRGTLKISVTENGYLKAKNSVRLKPKFRREGVITWLIEEGESVEKDEVLIEFDKTELNTQISELDTSLIQYEIELEAGRADQQIQESDNAAEVEKAELTVELARLALERYEKGDAPSELRKKELAAEKALSEFERAKERYKQVPELAQEGFLTKIQVEEERIRLREAEIQDEAARRDLELHNTYTHPMERTTKQYALKDAERGLENVRVKADINLKEKRARVTQLERQVDSTKTRLTQLGDELGKMTLRATQPGLVHYGDPNRRWMRDQIKVGNTLRQGNTAITLPDLSVMQVLIQVHEADIDLVKPDMPVVVTVETAKGKTFPAKVTDIATVASSQSWDDETNKTFRVEVTMNPVDGELRAGVTARAEVQVESIPDVLQVPIHAVYPESGEHFCHVLVEGKIERRRVVPGKNNAHHVAILEGLAEGDRVLLYDPRQEGVREIDDGGGDGESDGATPQTEATS